MLISDDLMSPLRKVGKSNIRPEALLVVNHKTLHYKYMQCFFSLLPATFLTTFTIYSLFNKYNFIVFEKFLIL